MFLRSANSKYATLKSDFTEALTYVTNYMYMYV